VAKEDLEQLYRALTEAIFQKSSCIVSGVSIRVGLCVGESFTRAVADSKDALFAELTRSLLLLPWVTV
jgi:hypothetical protein